jgi:hypothetical protein
LGFSGNLATAVGSSIIMTAGSVLVSALVPLPTPNMPSFATGGGSMAQPSPTYSLQGQGNYARLAQPIPVIYGRHLVYPDLAASPYGEYRNNEQYLHQLHCIGLGEYDIEQIRIEDTPITAFEEVEMQIIPPGGSNTLFNPDVVTAAEVAGQELLAAVWTGGFALNPQETQATHIGIDILLPRGLYFANDTGGLDARTATWQVDARRIDDAGDPLGDWATLGTEILTLATSTPQRLTFSYAVAPGRFEVRATRLDTKDSNSRAGHEVRWGEARAYLTSAVAMAQPLPDVTLLAIRMRATDNLSQRSSRLINCIVTRKLSVLLPSPAGGGGGTWSAPQATRSIAWAFADILRARYGAKLPDSRIDLATLHQLDQTWAARGDFFDAIFDQQITVWEALTRVARCGRAVPFLQGGIVRIVRDEHRTLPVALFSTRNIVKNSLKIQYVMPGEETADSVTVEFFSSRTWKPDEVTVSLPGSSTDNPAKLRLFGCTGAAQATREGQYIAAANRYRRRIITFRTELEGLIPTYGDLIAIAHDMPSWGAGGDRCVGCQYADSHHLRAVAFSSFASNPRHCATQTQRLRRRALQHYLRHHRATSRFHLTPRHPHRNRHRRRAHPLRLWPDGRLGFASSSHRRAATRRAGGNYLRGRTPSGTHRRSNMNRSPKMTNPRMADGMVIMPHDEFEELLERVAERGARHALSDVGLDGPDAARDIQELRSLLDAFNEAKKTAGITLIKMLVTGLVMVLLAGTIVKIKLFGGTQ